MDNPKRQLQSCVNAYRHDAEDFPARFVTLDEFWIHHYDVKTKMFTSDINLIYEVLEMQKYRWQRYYNLEGTTQNICDIGDGAKRSTLVVQRLPVFIWRFIAGRYGR